MKKTTKAITITLMVSGLFSSSVSFAACSRADRLLGRCSNVSTPAPTSSNPTATTSGWGTELEGGQQQVVIAAPPIPVIHNNPNDGPGGVNPNNPNNPGGYNPNDGSGENPGGVNPNDPSGYNPNNPTNPGGYNPNNPNDGSRRGFNSGQNPNGANNGSGSHADGQGGDNPSSVGQGVASKSDAGLSGLPFQSSSAFSDPSSLMLPAGMTAEQTKAYVEATLKILNQELKSEANDFAIAQRIVNSQSAYIASMTRPTRMTYEQGMQLYADYARMIAEYVSTRFRENDPSKPGIVIDVNGLMGYAWGALMRDVTPEKFPKNLDSREMLKIMHSYVQHFEAQKQWQSHHELLVLMQKFSANMFGLYDAMLDTADKLVKSTNARKEYAKKLEQYQKNIKK